MTDTPQSFRRLVALGLSGGALLGFNRLLGFLLTVMLARLMSQGDYGIYAFSVAAASLIGLPLSTGLPTLTIREAKLLADRDAWGHVRGLMAGGIVLTAAVSALVGAVALMLTHAAPSWAAMDRIVLWAVLLVPLTGLNLTAIAVLRALDRPMLAIALVNLVARTIMIAGVGLVWLTGTALDPGLAVAIHLTAEAALLAAALIALARALPPEWRGGAMAHDARAWLADVLPLTLASGFTVIHVCLGLFVTGLFWPAEEASLFRIAMLMMLVAETGFFLAIGLNTHRFARETGGAADPAYRAAVQDTAALALMTSLPAALLLALFGRDVLVMVFGPDYAAAYAVMLVLLIGQVFNVLSGPAAQMLSMARESRSVARAAILASVVYAAAAFLLAPALGALGAAIGATAGIVTFKALLVIECRRRLGIDPTPLALAGRARATLR